MEFEEFDALLQEVRTAQAGRTLPEGFQLFDSWIASEGDIERAETELTISLPEKYKWFMRRYGGGVFMFMDLLPVVSPDGRAEDLIDVSKGLFRETKFVAAAPVGTGDWWGFTVSEDICEDAVSFLSHDDESTTRSAADFLEFVTRQGLRIG